jgi:hypothetical protein
MFQIITVIIVLGIFSLFAYGAHKAEKIVAEKARLQREAQKKTHVHAQGNSGKTLKNKK